MPTIEVDFETFKAITLKRPTEAVTAGDIVRQAMGLDTVTKEAKLPKLPNPKSIWRSDGVDFEVGTKLRHRFRGGSTVCAIIVDGGVKVNDLVFTDLSPAAVEVTKCQQNGWTFWEVERSPGNWIKATFLRSGF